MKKRRSIALWRTWSARTTTLNSTINITEATGQQVAHKALQVIAGVEILLRLQSKTRRSMKISAVSRAAHPSKSSTLPLIRSDSL